MSHDVGTKQLFDERFVAFQDTLFGYIASLLPRRDDADEVFQETSLKLLQNRDKYDPNRPFAPWAFTIALNEVRLFIRRNRHQGIVFSEPVLMTVAETQFRSDSMLTRSLDRLSECVKQLTAEKRLMLEQCYSGEQSIKTIAARNGIQPEALYKQLERTRRVLFQCMQAGYAGEDIRDGS
jgi:RNA polymerase sigma-70 factor, ECF subfamily